MLNPVAAHDLQANTAVVLCGRHSLTYAQQDAQDDLISSQIFEQWLHASALVFGKDVTFPGLALTGCVS